MYWIRTNHEIVIDEKKEGKVFRPLTISSGMCYLIDQRERTPDLPPPFEKQYPLPILTSNLQKSIRRMHEFALPTAQYLIRQYPMELIRRLTIMMAEDTQLHTRYFPELVWLMVAMSRGYTLCESDQTVILESVQACLTTTERYHLDVRPEKRRTFTDSLSFAMYLRGIYGGMAGDIAFLDRLRSRYQEGRLRTCSHSVTLPPIPAFTVSMILPEAVDFHCYPFLLKEVGVSRSAIWWCKSSVNVRPIKEEEEGKCVEQYQRFLYQQEMKEHEREWNWNVRKILGSLVEEPRGKETPMDGL